LVRCQGCRRRRTLISSHSFCSHSHSHYFSFLLVRCSMGCGYTTCNAVWPLMRGSSPKPSLACWCGICSDSRYLLITFGGCIGVSLLFMSICYCRCGVRCHVTSCPLVLKKSNRSNPYDILICPSFRKLVDYFEPSLIRSCTAMNKFAEKL
jgi:hypothetical protein